MVLSEKKFSYTNKGFPYRNKGITYLKRSQRNQTVVGKINGICREPQRMYVESLINSPQGGIGQDKLDNSGLTNNSKIVWLKTTFIFCCVIKLHVLAGAHDLHKLYSRPRSTRAQLLCKAVCSCGREERKLQRASHCPGQSQMLLLYQAYWLHLLTGSHLISENLRDIFLPICLQEER